MRSFQKSSIVFLALLMLVLMIGCTYEDDQPDPFEAPTETPTEETTEAPPEEPTEAPTEASEDNELLEHTLESKVRLSFDENGEFRVLVLSDLHMTFEGPDEEMQGFIKELIDREDPDLVILNGDNITDERLADSDSLRACLEKAVAYIEEQSIPWMHVYGNHDEDYGYFRGNQQEVYESFDMCISKRGDDNAHGVGNYVIPVYAHDSDDIAFTVWALDSGNYLTYEDKMSLCPNESTYGGYSKTTYDFIDGSQIEWYVNTSKQLEEYAGGKVCGMMAFHIPLQEFYTAWVNREAFEYTGDKREDICASAFNSGLFAALHYRNDIKAVVCGHDHINDFMVNYGGIKLCYSSTISNTAYFDENIRGGRVFVIDQDDPSNIDTYMSYVGLPDDTPEIPDGDGNETDIGTDTEGGTESSTEGGTENATDSSSDGKPEE
ncbi:MAG: metallophosphoesterase family protein [Clostridia bacterium]|nr:metallophosphoesterase family protein [Clostridia bacterium]